MDEWAQRYAANHLKDCREENLNLQKLNRARGFSNEGLSLSDDDPTIEPVPLEMLHMLPPRNSAHNDGLQELPTDPIGSHPVEKFLAAEKLSKLVGASSTSDDDNPFSQWLQKAISEAQQLSSGRVTLPTSHGDHSDILAKGEIESSMISLLNKIKKNAADVGAYINFANMEKAARALDVDAFNQLFMQAMDTIDAAMHTMAA